MPREAKTHYLMELGASGMATSLCGWLGAAGPRFTRDRDAITCKSCLARLAELPFDPPVPEEVRAWEPPPPREVTRQSWSPAGRRVVERSKQGHAFDDGRRPFPTVRAALHALVVHRLDGAANGAPEPKKVRIQTTRIARAPRSIDRAGLLVPVARALERAFSKPVLPGDQPRRWHQLKPQECRAILLARLVGAERTEKVSRRRKPGEAGATHRTDRRLEVVDAEKLADLFGVDTFTVHGVVRAGTGMLRVELGKRRIVPDSRVPHELAEILDWRAKHERSAA